MFLFYTAEQHDINIYIMVWYCLFWVTWVHDEHIYVIYISFFVPQGSVLGPILFPLYNAPLSQVIAWHVVEHHLYVDDTQIHISLSGS